jgi:hypothetical protein
MTDLNERSHIKSRTKQCRIFRGSKSSNEKKATYRPQTCDLPRKLLSDIFWYALEVETEHRKRSSLVFLPLPNIINAVWRSCIMTLRDLVPTASISSSGKLPLKSCRLTVGGPSFEDTAFRRRSRNFSLWSCVLRTDSIPFYHLSLLRRLIFLLRSIDLSSRSFCALNQTSVRRVGGIGDVGQWCSGATGGHFGKRIVRRWRYEYSSCHS